MNIHSVALAAISRRDSAPGPKRDAILRAAIDIFADRGYFNVPVTGECELINAEMTTAGKADAPHVAGWLSHDGDVIEVLNLDALTPGTDGVLGEKAARGALEARP